MNLGKQILKLRKDNEMSQEDFAEIFNVTRQTISSWENSKSYPDIETLVKISDKFNISLDILLKGDKEMIKNMDKNLRNTSKYKKILISIGIFLGSIILVFGIYTVKYSITKSKLESNFKDALEENNFKKNRDGYYSYKFNEEITFSVPNQKMPNLLDFTLHFHNSNIYCDGVLENGKVLSGTWYSYNNYNFSVEDNGTIVGSSSSIKDKRDIHLLSKELGIEEEELKKIIDKGNYLYKDFYI